jgi:hypothetical protein
MNEKDLVKNIINSGFLENQFGRKTIQTIYKEFNVGNNKNIDIAVETLDFLYLIEVKVNLVSYDIGQIMVYMTSMKHDTFKRIKGILMYDSISDKELQLINETIKDFNIDVSLIKFSGVNVSPKKTSENQKVDNKKLENENENENLTYSELLNAIKSLVYAYKENEEVKASSFKNLLSIDTQMWRKIRTQLQKENYIYTKEGTKRSYKSKNIKN